MKFIPLGLQCSVPEGIKRASLREYSYPFDWLWTPSKTTYEILKILINDGVEKALQYMTNEYSYYRYLDNEHYMSVKHTTECQMNKHTGLGNTHFKINDDYKMKLRTRLERLINDIKSNEKILFIYADAANPILNYHLDEIEFGVDANEYLEKIYHLIYPINNNIKLVYFCWNNRLNCKRNIEYIKFNYKQHWCEVSVLINDYLQNYNDK